MHIGMVICKKNVIKISAFSTLALRCLKFAALHTQTSSLGHTTSNNGLL